MKYEDIKFGYDSGSFAKRLKLLNLTEELGRKNYVPDRYRVIKRLFTVFLCSIHTGKNIF